MSAQSMLTKPVLMQALTALDEELDAQGCRQGHLTTVELRYSPDMRDAIFEITGGPSANPMTSRGGVYARWQLTEVADADKGHWELAEVARGPVDSIGRDIADSLEHSPCRHFAVPVVN